MNAHVAKPVDPEELAATLIRWIKPTPSAASLTSDGLESSDFPKAVASLEAALPGVSVKSALARLFRNLPLYRKLLRSFADGYSTAPADIRAFSIADDKDGLHKLAHNFKGLAGNLGFDPIMKCSESVLLALRAKEQAQLPQLAEALAQECEKVLAALNVLPPSDS